MILICVKKITPGFTLDFPGATSLFGYPRVYQQTMDAYEFLDSRLPQPLDCDENAVMNHLGASISYTIMTVEGGDNPAC